MALNILKIISYLLILIPLIMLIGKAISRSRYEFVLKEKTSTDFIPDQTGWKPAPLSSARVKAKPIGRRKPAVTPISIALTDETAAERRVTPVGEPAAKSAIAQRIIRPLQVEISDETAAARTVASVEEPVAQSAVAYRIVRSFPVAISDETPTLRLVGSVEEPIVGSATVQGVQKSLARRAIVHRIVRSIPVVITDEAPNTKSVVALGEPKTLQEQKKYLMANLAEILQKERTFGNALQMHARLINDRDFLTVLNNSACREEILRFGQMYQVLVEMRAALISRLEAILPEKGVPNFVDLRRSVQAMCDVLQGPEFEEYMEQLGEVFRFQSRYEEIVDKSKLEMLLRKKKISVQLFDPCTILMQKLTRFPGTLKETRQILETMPAESELRSIQNTIERCDRVAMKYNLLRGIEDAKKCLEAHALARSSSKIGKFVQGWVSYVTGEPTSLQKVNARINIILRGRKVFEDSPPLDESELSPEQQEMQGLVRELLAIDLMSKEKKAKSLIMKRSRGPKDYAKLKKIADQLEGLNPAWILDPIRRIEIVALEKIIKANLGQ